MNFNHVKIKKNPKHALKSHLSPQLKVMNILRFYPPKVVAEHIQQGPNVFIYSLFGLGNVYGNVFFPLKMFNPPKADTQHIQIVFICVRKRTWHFENHNTTVTSFFSFQMLYPPKGYTQDIQYGSNCFYSCFNFWLGSVNVTFQIIVLR